MIEQEIWTLLLTHCAIRHLMCEAADQTDIDPDRLYFMRSLRVIRRQVTDQAGFPPPRLIAELKTAHEEIQERLNPPSAEP